MARRVCRLSTQVAAETAKNVPTGPDGVLSGDKQRGSRADCISHAARKQNCRDAFYVQERQR